MKDKPPPPGETELVTTLGRSYACWVDLTSRLSRSFGPLAPEWKYYGAKQGWVQKLVMKKRNLLFLIPKEKYFRIGMVFSDKAVDAMQKSDLPGRIINEVANAKKYAEGRGLRIDVHTQKDLSHIETLVELKVLH